MRKIIFILLAFTMFFYVACEDEETNPDDNEEIVDDGDDNNDDNGDETTYESGIVIDTYTADVDPNKFESQSDAQRVSLVSTEDSQTKTKSEEFFMLFENSTELDTLNVDGGGFVVFTDVDKIIPLNKDYFLVGDYVTVTITIPTYQDITEYDSISIADYIEQDVIKEWNIVDTMISSSNDTLLAYYDTITVVTEATEQYSYNNLIFNKITGDVFDLDDNISWVQTKYAANKWININADSTKVYYTNQNQRIIELDLSTSSPVKNERFNSTNYGAEICSNTLHIFDDNIAFFDNNTQRLVTISSNSIYDYLVKSDTMYIFNHTIFSNNGFIYYMSSNESNLTHRINKIRLLNDTIVRETVVEQSYEDVSMTSIGCNEGEYIYEFNNLYYIFSMGSETRAFGFDPFSSEDVTLTGVTPSSSNPSSEIVKQKGENIISYYTPAIYKLSLSTLNKSLILDNYNIFQMEVNNDESVTFFGFSLVDGVYVHGNVDFNGNLEIISTSEYDTSPIILTNIF